MNKKLNSFQSSALYPWLVWSIGAMFFFLMYIARVSPSIIQEPIMSEFKVNASIFGQMAGYLYVSYIIMQIPVGALVDRFGAHRLIIANTFVFGCACVLFSVANHMHWIMLSRLIMGLSGSFAFIGAFKLALIWFPPSMLGLLAGLTQCSGMLGAAVGEGPMSYLSSNLGWRGYILSLGIGMFMLFILGSLIMRSHPNEKSTQVESFKDLIRGIGVVICNPQSWLNGFYAGLIYMPTVAFGEAWGTPYLIQTKGFTLSQAGFAGTCLFIGWVIGGVLVGRISDAISLRKPIMISASLISAITFALVLYLPSITPLQCNIVLFFYGVANSGLIASYALSGEINPPQVSGVSVSFCNLISVLLGAFCIPWIGYVLDSFGGVIDARGVSVYPVDAYNIVFSLFPAGFILSGFISMFITETYCNNVHVVVKDS